MNGLFVDARAEAKLTRGYFAFLREHFDYDEILYRSKRLIMGVAVASELSALAVANGDRIVYRHHTNPEFNIGKHRIRLRITTTDWQLRLVQHMKWWRKLPGWHVRETGFRDFVREVPVLLARRKADHRAIDTVLAARVAAEDDELTAISGPGSLLDRLLRPLNQLGTKRFLREAREKVWANAVALSQARASGPQAYATASLTGVPAGGSAGFRPGRSAAI